MIFISKITEITNKITRTPGYNCCRYGCSCAYRPKFSSECQKLKTPSSWTSSKILVNLMHRTNLTGVDFGASASVKHKYCAPKGALKEILFRSALTTGSCTSNTISMTKISRHQFLKMCAMICRNVSVRNKILHTSVAVKKQHYITQPMNCTLNHPLCELIT